MMMKAPSETQSAWGRNIAIVYSIFALSTLGFVGFAMTQRVDLTSAEYYEEALKHDKTSLARARAANAGVHIAMRDSLIITLDPSMTFDEGILVNLSRADDPSLDRKLMLNHRTSEGVIIPVGELRRGRWKITATWTSDSKAYRIDDHLWIK
jgi:hypothetical protein